MTTIFKMSHFTDLKSWQSLLRESLENLIDWILLKKMYINNGSNLLSVWLQMQVIFRSFSSLEMTLFPFRKNTNSTTYTFNGKTLDL